MNTVYPLAHTVNFKPKALVLAVRKALPFLVALGLGVALIEPASGRSGDASAAMVANQLIRQFTLKNTVAQVSQGMQGYVQDSGGKLRARAMGPTPTGYPQFMGSVPVTTNLPQRDGAGRPLGYCAWDNNAVASDVNFLAGSGATSPLLYAVVSPGLDGRMDTTCDLILNTRVGAGDDHVQAVAPFMTSSSQYRTAVSSFAVLQSTPGEEGDIRLVTDTNRLYSFIGGAWVPINGGGFSDDSAANGAGAISYTAGKVTVADFQAASASITGNLMGAGNATFTGSLTAGTLVGNGAGLTDLNASNVSSGLLGTTYGGTGVNASAAAQGALLIGTGSGFALGTLGAGNGIAIVNGAGSIMISNTGVLSIAGTLNQINASAANGNVVLSLPQSIATTSTPTFAGAIINGNLDVMSLSQAGVPATLAFQIASDTGSGSYAEPNLAMGAGALAGRKGAGNVAVGIDVLGRMINSSSSMGTRNTGVGYRALYNNDSGDENTAVGFRSLYSNTTGLNNTAVGSKALEFNTTGTQNTAVGMRTLFNNTSGEDNTAVGEQALYYNTTGSFNTAIGQRSMFSNTTGLDNTAVGEESLTSNTTGAYNTAMGESSLKSNTFGSHNSAFGKGSLSSSTTASDNSAFGRDAMRLTTVGNENVAVGRSSMYNNSSGARNVAIGVSALSSNTSGFDNIAIGKSSGTGITEGRYNISIGAHTMDDANDYGYSTALGMASDVFNAGVLYATGLGAYSRVGSSNTVVLGALAANKSSQGYPGYVPVDDQVVIGASLRNDTYANTKLYVAGNSFINGNLYAGNATFSGAVNFQGGTEIPTLQRLTFGSSQENTDPQYLIRINPGVDQSVLRLVIGDNSDGFGSSVADEFQLGRLDSGQSVYTPIFRVVGSGDVIANGYVSASRLLLSDSSGGVGNPNLVIGNGAMASAATGDGFNTAVGLFALNRNTSGNKNVALGFYSLYANTTGIKNTALGTFALQANTTGFENTAVGDGALYLNTTGVQNVAMGQGALLYNTTGSGNTGLGRLALYNLTAGLDNTAVGKNAAQNITTSSFVTALGAGAMQSASGSQSVAVGRLALNAFSGQYQVAVGNSALEKLGAGDSNTAIGHFAMPELTSGASNIAIGHRAGNSITSGSRNIMIGEYSGVGLASSSNNIALGHNISMTAGISNSVAIGNDAVVNTSNTVVLGRTSDNIVLGATSDDGSGNKLQVSGGLKATGNVFLNTGSSSNYTQLRDLRVMSSFNDAAWDHLRIQTLGGVTQIDAGGAESGLIFRVGDGSSGGVGDQPYHSVLTLKADKSAVFEGRVDVQSLYIAGELVAPANRSGINSALTVASSIGAAAPQANLALGQFALDGVARAGNVAIGENVLTNLSASANSVHGVFNTGLGYGALTQNTTGSYNTALGSQALLMNTTGNENIAIGRDSMVSNTIGSRNVSIGSNAMRNSTTGGMNSAIGTNALFSNTTGSENTAVGDNALFSNTSGQYNSAFGTTALFLNTTGYENTGIGKNALFNNTTGYHNSAVGLNSLFSNSTGYNNAALGRSALQNSSTGINNTAVGAFALFNTSVANDNTALGLSALFNNTTGSANVALGMQSLLTNTTGRYNLAVGTAADVSSGNLVYASAIGNHARVGSSNTLVLGALGANKNASASTTDDQVVIGASSRNDTYSNTKLYVAGNTFINGNLYASNATFGGGMTFNGTPSFQAGIEISTAQKLRFGADFENTDSQYFERQNSVYNQTVTRFVLGDDGTTFGHFEADEFQVGYLNSGVSYTPVFRIAGSGDVIVKGYVSTPRLSISDSTGGVSYPNIAVGAGAMSASPSGFGANTAVGINALNQNTSGNKNTALGTDALAANTTGIRNTGLGYGALRSNVSGFENTVVGDGAAFFTTGNENTVLGQAALYYNTTGSKNVVLGHTALYNNQSGSSNIVVGLFGLGGNTSGNGSVAIGNYSLASLSSGGNNIAIGNQSGQTLTTGSRNIFLGELVGQFTPNSNDNIGIGHQVNITSGISHAVAIGNDASVTTSSTVVLGRTRDTVVIGATGTDGSGDKLQVSGGVRATAFNVSSDRRLKTAIQMQDADQVLERLEQMRTYSYQYIDSPGLGRRIGVIAQELQGLFPEVVATRPDSIMSVDYNALGAMAAMGVGQLNTKFKLLDTTVKEQALKVSALDELTRKHDSRLGTLEQWKTEATGRMDNLQTAIDLNIEKIAANALAIASNTEKITTLEQVTRQMDSRLGVAEGNLARMDLQWNTHFTSGEDGQSLTIKTPNLIASNFVAEQMRSKAAYTERLEAEMARIRNLEVDNLRANNAVARNLQAETVNTGSVQVYAGAGLPAVLFAASADGHYSVSTSALDGSYATATVIVNAGQAKVVAGASEGIELMAEGNRIKAVAAGKSIRASWIKTG